MPEKGHFCSPVEQHMHGGVSLHSCHPKFDNRHTMLRLRTLGRSEPEVPAWNVSTAFGGDSRYMYVCAIYGSQFSQLLNGLWGGCAIYQLILRRLVRASRCDLFV